MGKIELAALCYPEGPVAEAYRKVRVNLMHQDSEKPIKVVEFTCAAPNDEKSLLTANLGIMIAQTTRNVLIIDCDFHHPMQHQLFQCANQGLSEYLSVFGDIQAYIQETEQPGLSLLAAGGTAANSSGLLNAKAMSGMMDELRQRYDYILLDAPPALALSDASELSSLADGVVFSVISGEDSRKDAKRAKMRLEQAGANLIGCVLLKEKTAYDKKDFAYHMDTVRG